MKTSVVSISLLLLTCCKAEPATNDVSHLSLESSLRPAIFGGPYNGALSQTQDQKTVICPEVTQDLYEGHVQYGPRTRFILTNTATDPVAVTFVHRNGTEYSAANAHVQPATMDPDAMLAPGVTKVFAVHEGHVFHVRDKSTGELLMQHRAGLVPVENRYDREIAFCPNTMSNATVINNMDKDSYRVMRKFPQWKPAHMENYNEDVDLDIGYKNKVTSQSGSPCPINLFFVRRQDSGRRRPPQYLERFSLQLGGNDMSTCQDDDWDANTKYERTFLGHEFVARLAHDDSVVVDHLIVEPIKVQDCAPKKKKTVKAAALARNAIVIPVGRHFKMGEEDDIDVNQTEWQKVLHLLNTTESKRGLYFKMYTK